MSGRTLLNISEHAYFILF